jgi:type IV secretory pathway VirJ component
VHAQSLPGGHHFDGAYDKLAELILQRAANP